MTRVEVAKELIESMQRDKRSDNLQDVAAVLLGAVLIETAITNDLLARVAGTLIAGKNVNDESNESPQGLVDRLIDGHPGY